jgi:hypothetical protein
MLIAYIGEKWHSLNGEPVEIMCSCGEKWAVQDMDIDVHENRPFTTDKDAGDLARKLVEKGRWAEFLDWIYEHSQMGNAMGNENENYYFDAGFISWLLIDPARFCDMVGEWREGK